jgi:YYY domain-containing protein
LAAILIVAAILRFTGQSWDQTHYLHPDERFITGVAISIQWPGSVDEYFNSATSPLNPYNQEAANFAYGTFPLFFDKFVADIFGKDYYDGFHEASRSVSAFFDLLTLLLLFFIGRRLFGVVGGLLAATLFSFTVLHIQLSHFGTVDVTMTFFCVATFYFALRASDSGKAFDFALTGLCAGLAVASKLPALPIVAVVAMPLAEQMRLHGWRSIVHKDKARPGSLAAVSGTLIAVFFTALAFRIAEPYAFLGPHIWNLRLDPRWTNDMRHWRELGQGVGDWPPGIQWANRAPIFFVLKNLVVWGMGIPLGITALVGLALGGVRIVTARTWPPAWQLVLIGWPTYHILYYGTNFVKTMRYLLPAYPFLVLLAAGVLVRLWHRGSIHRLGGASFRWGQVVAAVVVLLTGLYGIAFARIYTEPDTRITASHWFYENIPPGSHYLTEHWDEGFPLLFPGDDNSLYTGEQLELFNKDDYTKLNKVVSQLDAADYIFIVSNRLYTEIPLIPERYPMTTEYYKMLFSGDLGFKQVKTFTSYPNLFGVELNDDSSEEAFTVYDHPKVLVFQKTDTFDKAAVQSRLGAALNQDIVNLRPILSGKNMLMMTDAERVTAQSSGTWSSIFNRDSVTNKLPILFWYLALQLMALAALPLCWRVLSGLPDRGYAVAKAIGLLLVTYFAWLLPSLHVFKFGRLAVVIGILLAALISLAAIWSQRRAFIADIRGRWREIYVAEAIFLAAFLLFVWFRSMNPDLWHIARGGEKPMEFAYFNAVLRSAHFPPYDPWFAGGYINYYYFGYVLVASVTRLTGIIPAVAFNLAVPTFFALTVLTAWSFTANVLRMLTSELQWRSWWRPLAAALLGPLFVTLLGNLDMPLLVARGDYGYPVTSNTGMLGIASGIWNSVMHPHELPTDAFWASTRVIDGTVNEFPFFTFLFSDLHPHLMAIPFAITALIVALGVLRSEKWPAETATIPPETDEKFFGLSRDIRSLLWSIPTKLTGDRAWLIGLTALVTGALYPLNTWDYPTYLGLIVGAFVLLELINIASTGWQFTFASLRRVAFWAAGTIVLGRLLFWPYYAHFSQSNRGFINWTEQRTTASQYLTIFGLLLFFVVTFILFDLLAAGPGSVKIPFIRPNQFLVSKGAEESNQRRLTASITYSTKPLLVRLTLAIAAVLLVIVLAGAFGNNLTELLCGLLALTAVAAWFRRNDPIRLFIIAMTGAAIVISLVVERYTLRGDIGRMNTVFKFYLEVWVLLALAGAIGTVIFLVRYGRALRWPGLELWIAVAVLLVAAGLVYPALATPARLNDRFLDSSPTLNGMAYMPEAIVPGQSVDGTEVLMPLDDDYKAINWLLDNVQGSPVILEAQTPEYRWGSRVSIYTGLPTVIGWNWHQRQQRGGYESLVEQRSAEVRFMYNNVVPFSAIQPLLDKYHVKYIYLGDLERAYYDQAGLDKFDQAVADGQLTVVYDDSGVKIYEYDGATTADA